MEKHISKNKGFTFLETMIVLLLISMVMIIYPTRMYLKNIQIKEDILVLYEFLLQAQNEAIIHHQRNVIVLDGKEVKSSFQQLTLKELEIVYITFHYNAKGHSSRALTISFINSKDKIVMQLGSGSLDLR
jgi:prepilin-type N-terminal cleavage/methylation domain-containing protein